MTRLLLICGSQRRISLNARLLDEVASYVPAPIQCDRLRDVEVALPLFNQDLEDEPALRDKLACLHSRFAQADGLIIASPEYNGTITPYLKNLIDWISRLPHIAPGTPNAFLDKPVLLCSATPGWSGGGVGIPALRALLGYVGAISFGETINLPYGTEAWDAEGKLDTMLAELDWPSCVARFCNLTARHAGAKP